MQFHLGDGKKIAFVEGLVVLLMALDLLDDLKEGVLGARLLGCCTGLGLTTAPHQTAYR